MRNLDKTTLEDILVGCAYLGTGGGGDFESGLRRVYEALDEGLSFRLMDVSELGDDEYSAVPYELGSSAPRTPEVEARYAHLPRIKEPTTLASFRSLEQYIGIPFKAVIAGEIGPGNTASSLVLAARLGLPSLDADTVGRDEPQGVEGIGDALPCANHACQRDRIADQTLRGSRLLRRKRVQLALANSVQTAARHDPLGLRIRDLPLPETPPKGVDYAAEAPIPAESGGPNFARFFRSIVCTRDVRKLCQQGIRELIDTE